MTTTVEKCQLKAEPGIMPLSEQLRMQARANKTVAWESQARMLMEWAANTIDAANEALRNNAESN